MAKSSASPPESVYRSRIVGLADVPPLDILANPLNWRVHPDSQKAAMEALLRSKGWSGVVIVNQTTGRILDGHMRAEIAITNAQPTIPVVYIEAEAAEEPELIAAFHAIGDQAGSDRNKLLEVLSLVQTTEEVLGTLYEDLREGAMQALVLPQMPTEAAYAPNPYEQKFANDPNRQAAALYPPGDATEPTSGQTSVEVGDDGEPVRVGGVGTGDTVVVPPQLTATGAKPPAALRVIQMLLEPDVYDRVIGKLKLLSAAYGTISVVETIVRVIDLAEVPGADAAAGGS